MLRIAQVVDSLDIGGAERLVVTLANSLAKLGVASHILVTRHSGELAGEIDKEVKLFIAQRRSRFDYDAFSRMVAFVNSHGIQLLHAHGHTSAYWAKVISRRCVLSPQVILHDHIGHLLPGSRWGEILTSVLDRIILGRDAASFSVNASLLDKNKALFDRSRCVEYLQNGIDCEKFSRCVGSLKERRLVQIANYRAAKGHGRIAEIVRLLIAPFPELRWECFGHHYDSEARKSAEAAVCQVKLHRNVFFHPAQQNTAALLQGASIGVLTSDEEGLPLALLEYMAAGLPVVVTDAGDCKKVVAAAESGLVVPSRDSAAFAAAISFLLMNPQAANPLGEKGRRFVQKHHNVRQMVEKLLRFYQRVLQNGSGQLYSGIVSFPTKPAALASGN